MGVWSGQALPGGSPLHKDLKKASKEPQRRWGDERSRQRSQMCKGPKEQGACLGCLGSIKGSGMAVAGLAREWQWQMS